MTKEEFELNLTLMGYKVIPSRRNNSGYRGHYSNGDFDIHLSLVTGNSVLVFKIINNENMQTDSYEEVIKYIT